MKKLETKRLILRRPYMKDLKDYHNFAKLNNVGPSAGWLPHESLKESRDVLKEHIKRADLWVIVLKTSNHVIGTINLEVADFFSAINGIVELGYALSSNYWNQGLMSEAVTIVIDYAFNNLQVNKIICGHTLDNDASKKIILKQGFEFIELDRSRKFENEDITEVYMYELTKERYEVLKDGNKI